MEVLNLKSKILNLSLELFFPSFCLGCQKEGVFICQDCRATLEISEYNYCLCSKNPFRLAPSQKGNPQGKCSRCKDRKLSGLYSALPYKERLLTKKLIYSFKYSHLKSLSSVLAGIIIEHLFLAGNNIESIWKNSILVPVPIDIKRMKDRGYNQAEELAKELSKVIKVPVVLDILVKVKPTPSQTALSKEAREKNLKDSFSIKKPAEIASKRIFLVDDVYTTGSTMEECSRILREAGVKSVWGIAIAREG